MKHVLFVCKYNRFRSKIAENLFKKYNNKIKVKSAGIIKGSFTSPFQGKICKKFGINIKSPTKGISTNLLKWQDTIVIVADDVPRSIFKENKKFGKKLIVWDIPDAKTDKEQAIIKIIKTIDKKVKKLANEK